MLGYITLGTNDLERACNFYDSLFDQAPLFGRLWGRCRVSFWHPGSIAGISSGERGASYF